MENGRCIKKNQYNYSFVIPAEAGIQSLSHCRWTPASAGVTSRRN